MSPDFAIDISDVMPAPEACYHHFGESLGDQLTQEKRTGAAFRGLKYREKPMGKPEKPRLWYEIEEALKANANIA